MRQQTQNTRPTNNNNTEIAIEKKAKVKQTERRHERKRNKTANCHDREMMIISVNTKQLEQNKLYIFL